MSHTIRTKDYYMEKRRITEEDYHYLQFLEIPQAVFSNVSIGVYAKGEYICREGEEIENLMYIIKGNAKVSITAPNGRTLLFCFYRNSGLLGDVELMLEKGAISNVIAITEVTCILMPVSECRKLILRETGFLRHLAKGIAYKLEGDTSYAILNSLYPLETRLCAYIQMVTEDGVFGENLTEISELLGTSYRHLLRVLLALCEKKVLKHLSGGKYQILNMEHLEICANECFGIL